MDDPGLPSFPQPPEGGRGAPAGGGVPPAGSGAGSGLAAPIRREVRPTGPVPGYAGRPPGPLAGPGLSRSERHAHRRARQRQVRQRRLVVLVAAVAVMAVVVLALTALGGGGGAPGPAAGAVVASTMAPMQRAPAGRPHLPWPATGQAAVAIPALGFASQSGPEHPVPVASMTKVMTAYVVLKDHPITGNASGPDITISPADAADYTTDVVTTQASVEVQAGEVLTERQALDGMLVHSANNLAYALACWDAGSLPAFVAKMNAAASALGMAQTHYVDASGYTKGSVSTPADLLKVTSAAMADPVFAQAVAMPSVTLPVAGTVSTYTPLLPGSTTGAPGVVGVKSGFTTAAGGGDILAYQARVGGQTLTVLAAVTSQEGPEVLHAAGEMDLAVAQAAAGSVVAVPVAAAGERVGRASVDGRSVPVVTATAGSLLAWPGQRIRQVVVVTHHPPLGARTGAPVGTALFTLGEQQVAVPVRTAAPLHLPH